MVTIDRSEFPSDHWFPYIFLSVVNIAHDILLINQNRTKTYKNYTTPFLKTEEIKGNDERYITVITVESVLMYGGIVILLAKYSYDYVGF